MENNWINKLWISKSKINGPQNTVPFLGAFFSAGDSSSSSSSTFCWVSSSFFLFPPVNQNQWLATNLTLIIVCIKLPFFFFGLLLASKLTLSSSSWLSSSSNGFGLFFSFSGCWVVAGDSVESGVDFSSSDAGVVVASSFLSLSSSKPVRRPLSGSCLSSSELGSFFCCTSSGENCSPFLSDLPMKNIFGS